MLAVRAIRSAYMQTMGEIYCILVEKMEVIKHHDFTLDFKYLRKETSFVQTKMNN